MVLETTLYDTLGVSPLATTKDIVKAYRKLAMRLHPDKPTGDAQKFQQLQAAHEVLIDAGKRKLYDTRGQQGLDEPPQHQGFHGFSTRRNPTKANAVTFTLTSSLEQLYQGCTRKLSVKRNIVCIPCKGQGGNGIQQVCSNCRGRGVQIQMRPLGPGMMQQVQTACTRCYGTGNRFTTLCSACTGQGTVTSQTVVEIHIPRGASDGQKIVCLEKGHEALGLDNGDLVLTIREKPHAFFKRQGRNLFCTQHLSLLHALTGFSSTLTHLDGHTLHLVSSPDRVTSNSVQVLRGEGMPGSGSGGDLFIEFIIDFPTEMNLSSEQQTTLATLLQGTLVKPSTDGVCPHPVDLVAEKEQWIQQAREQQARDLEGESGEAQQQCQTQ